MSGLLLYSHVDDFPDEAQRQVKEWMTGRMKEISGEENIEDLFLDYVIELIGCLLTHSFTYLLAHLFISLLTRSLTR